MAAAVLVGTRLDGDGARTAGPVEIDTVLYGGSANEDPRATAHVTKTGIGRVIDFDSDNLPTLPQGQYYELWFVGPGDTPARPNRISAGTFHPDEQGRSRVTFAAAVDPAAYPGVSVTSEPADGNPQRTGPEALCRFRGCRPR